MTVTFAYLSRTYRLSCVLLGLTFRNSTLCSHGVFTYFVRISGRTAITYPYSINWLMPEAVRSEAYFCSRLIAGIAVSYPAEGMDVHLLRLLCVV